MKAILKIKELKYTFYYEVLVVPENPFLEL